MSDLAELEVFYMKNKIINNNAGGMKIKILYKYQKVNNNKIQILN